MPGLQRFILLNIVYQEVVEGVVDSPCLMLGGNESIASQYNTALSTPELLLIMSQQSVISQLYPLLYLSPLSTQPPTLT